MATVGGGFSTLDAGSWPSANAWNHEDLVDMVTILAQTNTPAFSGFPKTRAKDVVHSWMVDVLAAATGSAFVEGEDFVGVDIASATRLVNGTQIFRKFVVVTDRERAANPAGIRDMYEHQIMKGFKELARHCEATIWRTTTTASSSGTEAVAPTMRGITGFPITLLGATVSGVSTADIITLSQTMFTNGAEPDSIWFSPPDKKGFFLAVTGGGANINTRNIAATDNRFQANIEVMETPFGQLYAIITDAFIPSTSASAQANASGFGYFIGDRSMAKLAFFRPPQHVEMGKNGDHTRGMILMELTLQLDHPSAWGAVTGITGA